MFGDIDNGSLDKAGISELLDKFRSNEGQEFLEACEYFNVRNRVTRSPAKTNHLMEKFLDFLLTDTEDIHASAVKLTSATARLHLLGAHLIEFTSLLIENKIWADGVLRDHHPQAVGRWKNDSDNLSSLSDALKAVFEQRLVEERQRGGQSGEGPRKTYAGPMSPARPQRSARRQDTPYGADGMEGVYDDDTAEAEEAPRGRGLRAQRRSQGGQGGLVEERRRGGQSGEGSRLTHTRPTSGARPQRSLRRQDTSQGADDIGEVYGDEAAGAEETPRGSGFRAQGRNRGGNGGSVEERQRGGQNGESLRPTHTRPKSGARPQRPLRRQDTPHGADDDEEQLYDEDTAEAVEARNGSGLREQRRSQGESGRAFSDELPEQSESPRGSRTPRAMDIAGSSPGFHELKLLEALHATNTHLW